jgi:serine/threonine protein kinase
MEKYGAAVELLYCNWEPTVGRWVVITKYHEPLSLEKQSQADINHLRKALVNLHDQGYVHGDVRAPNIIVDKDDKPRFIDFDWSHKIGEARYPNSLNPAINWPRESDGGGLIKAEHELEMLSNCSEYIGAKVTTL